MRSHLMAREISVRNNIYCLMVSGVSLSRRMADVLFDTACMMLKKGEGRKRIKDIEIEGEIHTGFQDHRLGSVSGTEFIATVETELGSGTVKYLVREIDAEHRNKGEWVPYFSVEDLMDEIASPPSRMNPACN